MRMNRRRLVGSPASAALAPIPAAEDSPPIAESERLRALRKLSIFDTPR
jgi:hypothetical protein